MSAMKEIMMLAAEKRDGSGTRTARRLRSAGRVPCVIYGHKQDPVSATVDATALETALRHHTRMMDLELGGQRERVLLHDVQYDTFGIEVVHADFLRVAMDETIRLEVPVETRGKPKGETHGGTLEQVLTQVEVECLPGDIPDSITFVVTDLDVGDTVYVSDLKAPENVKIVTDESHVVLTVAAPKKAEEEAAPVEGEAAAEPELIGRAAKEEEEGEEEESK